MWRSKDPATGDYIWHGSNNRLILYQASDTYRKTMEGLSKALSEIGDCIMQSIEDAKVVNTIEMRDAISQLYATVFQFLREAMLWYRAKDLVGL